MKRLFVFIVFFLCFISNIVMAQVEAVNYQLEFDEDTGLYDANLIIVLGSGTTIPQRVQFNSQYTLVAPAESTFEVVESFMPLRDNAEYTGTEPMNWGISVFVLSPEASPDKDFYSISPELNGGPYYYNNLNPGDTIHLFSVSIEDFDGCPLDPRVFINGVDPSSSAPGMQGGNYSCGFTLGNDNQLYNENSIDPNFEEYLDISLPDYTICAGECIDLIILEECVPYGITYTWPDSTIGSSYTVCPSEESEYLVVATGPNGYIDSLTSIVKPIEIETNGISTLCIGETANFLPATGGTWTSSNDSIITISNEGLLQALSSGIVQITYSSVSGCSDSVMIEVNPPILTELTGSDSICVFGTTTFFPTSGGSWTSANPVVASINNVGLVTGITPGVTSFIHTPFPAQCPSEPSVLITVLPGIEISAEEDTLCVGEGTLATSSDPDVIWFRGSGDGITIDSISGEVTAIEPGMFFVYAENEMGCQSNSESIFVQSPPEIHYDGPTEICIGANANIFPGSGGTWMSSDESVATITDNGVISGVGLGTAKFSFTSSTSGCTSLESKVFTVVGFNLAFDELSICPGSYELNTMGLEGMWESSNDSILTVDSLGFITTKAPGETVIIFTESSNGCSVEINVTVNSTPEISLSGSSKICIGESTSAETLENGFWTSNDPSIATVDNNGTINGITEGATELTFTDILNGCPSNISITVLPNSDPLCTVSTKEKDLGSIVLYPNPATDIIYIQTEQQWEKILIIDVQGRVVNTFSKINNGTFNLDVISYNSGVYYIQFQGQNSWIIKRFIIL